MDKLLAVQRHLRSMVDAPATQFACAYWNANVANNMIFRMEEVEQAFDRLGSIITGSPEVDACMEIAYEARHLSSAIANLEMRVLIAEPGGESILCDTSHTADLTNASTQSLHTPNDTFTAAEGPIITERDDLPTHLSYSCESFKSAADTLPESVAVSSKARVEITESETRPMFVSTTVIDDKHFVNPVAQSPMCPTARDKSTDSITTADVQPSAVTADVHTNPCNTYTADCFTAHEIPSSYVISANNDESMVEPLTSVFTAMEGSGTTLNLKTTTARSRSPAVAPSASLVVGGPSGRRMTAFRLIQSMLTARGLSLEDLRTAISTTTPTHLARWDNELNTEHTQNDVSEVGAD
ncbi:unnamed protein product, partial [Mesorhabditis spiculigera]